MQVGVLCIQADFLRAFFAGQAEQAVEKIPALLAQTGQQRIADIQVPILGIQFRALGQFADIADIAPDLAARAEGKQHHLRVLRQTLQHTQVMRRQAADAENHNPFGQPGDHARITQAPQQIIQQARPVRVAVLGQLAPEQCLPCLVGAKLK